MRPIVRSVTGSIVLLMLVSSCNFRPLDSDQADAWYDFAAACLDVYFIYREKLPSDLYAYSSPQALYESVDELFTVFLTPTQAKARFADLSTERGGIGIRVDSVAKGYVIENVYDNTPAEDAGLRAGDTILRVDGIALAGVSTDSAVGILQGDIGTEVLLRIKRGGNQLNITVIRGTFMLPSVEVDSLDSVTAYIQLIGFLDKTVVPGGSAEEFSQALDATSWADYTVLDLRHNGGGYIDQCIEIVGQLVPPKTPIVNVSERQYDRETDRGITVDTVYTTDGAGEAASRTLFILVDRKTASASEMLVSCLMEQADERVTVIGTTTYGKGRGQVMVTGPDSVLAVVTSLTITPVGDSAKVYDLVGITPDVLIDTVDAFDVAMDLIGEEAPAKRRAGRYYKKPGVRDVTPHISEPSAIVREQP